jgi:hypothetical protein
MTPMTFTHLLGKFNQLRDDLRGFGGDDNDANIHLKTFQFPAASIQRT